MKGERWKPIPGYEGVYDASTFGRVRRRVGPNSLGRGTFGGFIKPVPVLSGKRRQGFKVMRLSLSLNGKVKGFIVAHIILLTFRGPRPDNMKQARHLDDDQANNRLSNLRWGTSKQNGQDRIKNGRSCPGSTNGNAKLTEAQARKIRALYRAAQRGMIMSISKGLGVPYGIVYSICRDKTWRHTGEKQCME